MRLRRERIPEEEDDVEAPLGDERADLRVAAERTREQHVDGQVELLGDGTAGRRGRVDLAIRERVAIERGPLRHLVLAGVVRDEGYAEPFGFVSGECER